MTNKRYPYLGFGLGLRAPHYQYILEHKPAVDWFEIVSENYFVAGGRPLFYLDKIREHYPMVMHGVSLSIGSTDPLNMHYLQQLKQLAQRVQPRWISDHLCWTGVEGKNTHDLLPLPYTEEAVQHVVERVQRVQDYLGQQILLENVSTYITFKQSEMEEWEFLTQIAERADCFILLDINNIYVNSVNHHFCVSDYLQAVPVDRVKQFHMAGHTNKGDFIIDTHDHPIITEVWDYYQEALQYFGKVSIMIERDDNIPEFPELMAELTQARRLAEQVWSSHE